MIKKNRYKLSISVMKEDNITYHTHIERLTREYYENLI